MARLPTTRRPRTRGSLTPVADGSHNAPENPLASGLVVGVIRHARVAKGLQRKPYTA